MSIDAKGIAANLRLSRIKAGLSQGDVGKHFGVTRQAVSMWERGIHKVSAELAGQLAEYYGVSIENIYDPFRALMGVR